MKKTMTIFSAALLAAAFFLSAAHAQMPEKGAKNTMTLPNGEVIWDLNGEWELLVERYGPAKSEYGNYNRDPYIRITQEGRSFLAVRIKEDFWHKAGSLRAVSRSSDNVAFCLFRCKGPYQRGRE